MNKILLWAIVLIIAAGGAFYLKDSFQEERMSDAELVSYFQGQMISLGIQDIGQPIEGFDDSLLTAAFPGLQPEDFEGVEAFEGKYEVKDGVAAFVRDGEMPVSSAERTVSEAGYGTLLENLSKRLNMDADTEQEIDALIRAIDVDAN